MAEMVYLQLAESVLAEKRKVLIRDVSKVVSDNLDLKNKIEKIELMNFSTSSKEQQVISPIDLRYRTISENGNPGRGTCNRTWTDVYSVGQPIALRIASVSSTKPQMFAAFL